MSIILAFFKVEKVTGKNKISDANNSENCLPSQLLHHLISFEMKGTCSYILRDRNLHEFLRI